MGSIAKQEELDSIREELKDLGEAAVRDFQLQVRWGDNDRHWKFKAAKEFLEQERREQDRDDTLRAAEKADGIAGSSCR